MKKVMVFCIFFITLFLVLIGRSYVTRRNSIEIKNRIEVVEEDKHFKIIKQGDDSYHYIIYNKDKRIVKESNHYGNSPIIKYIDEKNIQILLPAGTDIFFCIYYDVYNDRFSEQYESPITIHYGKIVYLNYEKEPFTLVVSDIYNKKKYFKEFNLENLSFAISPIVKAEFLDNHTLNIVYLSGEQYVEKRTVLILD